ncbi:hypothetical protein CU669_19010 [Paramagnetospirillum kuznetsovii]|uniref:Uncharacterized protein n=1 Tax=Paramagnetospirillum kuznetsovii TaxID=2053833 RepID=A0A364NTE1_9PROT|nr:hypothetical protein CU669_19010 [Paramagnetospirillum kuznetsovii]
MLKGQISGRIKSWRIRSQLNKDDSSFTATEVLVAASVAFDLDQRLATIIDNYERIILNKAKQISKRVILKYCHGEIRISKGVAGQGRDIIGTNDAIPILCVNTTPNDAKISDGYFWNSGRVIADSI